MSFTDNGVGFDSKIKNIGIGIQNMKDRVLLLNGKFTINSIKKGNTYINISIPMQLGKRS
jgi:signal transduction histidine kinase